MAIISRANHRLSLTPERSPSTAGSRIESDPPAPIDGFHQPRELRYQRGCLSAEGYSRDSFCEAALLTESLTPFREGTVQMQSAGTTTGQRPGTRSMSRTFPHDGA